MYLLLHLSYMNQCKCIVETFRSRWFPRGLSCPRVRRSTDEEIDDKPALRYRRSREVFSGRKGAQSPLESMFSLEQIDAHLQLQHRQGLYHNDDNE
jgi:hypothetical protein